MIMKKVICLLSLLACLFPVTGMAQGLHFGLKAGVLGNKADIHGMSSQIKEENQTGFQVGPMLQYQTGFYGLALDFSALYLERPNNQNQSEISKYKPLIANIFQYLTHFGCFLMLPKFPHIFETYF